MAQKNDYAQSGGSRHHFLPAGRRFGCGRAGLIFLSLRSPTSPRSFLSSLPGTRNGSRAARCASGSTGQSDRRQLGRRVRQHMEPMPRDIPGTEVQV